MATEYDLLELQKKRRAKKRKRFLSKVIVVVLLVAAAVAMYIFRDKWLPFFEGIGTRYDSVVNKNSGELAEGNFPISVTGNSDYQTAVVNSYIAYLDDTHFYMYSGDGERVTDRQHTYSKPVMKAGGQRALLYDSGGKKFSVEGKQKTVYSRVLDNNIIFARISSNDMVAVVTESDNFACELKVFKSDGTECYSLKNADERIVDVVFKNANDGCIVTTLSASGGKLVSTLYSYDFNRSEQNWNTEKIKTAVMSLDVMSDGTIVAFGDDRCVYVDRNGGIVGSYEYPSKLVDYECGSGTVSLIFENEELRKDALVIISDITKDSVHISLDGTAKSLHVTGDHTTLLTDSGLVEYTQNGTVVASAQVNDDYFDFVRLGKYMFLKGYTEINRIDYSY